MELLLGKEISLNIKEQIKKEVEFLLEKPSLFVLVNENDSSSLGYVASLEKTALNLGITFEKRIMKDSEEEYINTIKELNENPACSAIMVTRPLFKGAREEYILSFISPLKDVDVMNKVSLGDIFVGNDDLAPATAKATMKMIEHYGIELKGKDCLVIGRSISVGKPLSMMLLNKHATVTIAHSRTVNLMEKVKNYDVVVVAVGIPHFLDSSLCKEDAIVLDCGIHYLDDGRIVGDVLPSDNVSKLSKVPGGIGTITTSVLMENVLKLYKKQRS
ncbi:MAG: bifunctional 5,10-methylenetetrahydrofolate dehydrogenase/5,10-methenyltetrahydrofolate cyclohydrolase [Erysipelotrichaceae bacterium]|nr:bifunctional 5,10-methylenetetrahydrofolate dehydrogenase/5,10-methenyltetrahydrofolate cyclohydrolase [Erysipelotrichaceae bacterium]